jgi:hypothetical protein
MLRLDKTLTMPVRDDTQEKEINITNHGITLVFNGLRFTLNLDSARDLLSMLEHAVSIYADFVAILPYLETIAGTPAGPVLTGMAQYLPNDIPPEIDRRLIPPCPTCGAGPGQPCVDPDDSLIGFGEIHSEREDAD